MLDPTGAHRPAIRTRWVVVQLVLAAVVRPPPHPEPTKGAADDRVTPAARWLDRCAASTNDAVDHQRRYRSRPRCLMSQVVWEVCARNAAYMGSSSSPPQCTANASSDDGSEGGVAPSNQSPISVFTAAHSW